MGKLYLILVAIMIFIAVSISGIFAPPFPQNKPTDNSPEWYRCCDSGDGDKCEPNRSQTIQFERETYALLKSNTYPVNGDEQYDHFEHAATLSNFGGIYINSANKHDTHDRSSECQIDQRDNTDWIRSGPAVGDEKGCTSIPKKIVVYLCRYDKNSPPNLCNRREVKDPSVTFDVYIRLSDAGNIPDPIKNCNKPPRPNAGGKKIVFHMSPGGQPNLQLRTFQFVEEQPKSRWLAPFCKPAIYLYPERKTEINVSVFPQGKMLLTIPPYPKTGWDVVADSNGDIYTQNNRFDYLYYEASLPDELIPQPKEGFVMNYDERALFLTDLVTKLGLNEKETKQFVEYWVPILPKAKYYFVGIMPQPTLHEISPLLITPKPKHLLRVTLYFKPLEDKIPVKPPLILPFSRDGYTAVEWGGIFKQDKDHPFSCFM
jgi:hypothetical protein